MVTKEYSKLYVTIIFILSVFCLFLIGIEAKNRKTVASKTVFSNTGLSAYERIISGLETDNLTINIETVLRSFHNRQLYVLKDIIHKDSLYLIFRSPLSHCGACINTILEKLHEYKESIPCIQIIVLVSDAPVREQRIRMLPFEDKFRMYSLLLHDFGLPPENLFVPYFLFINDGETAKHTFIVESDSIELIENYLQMLSKKYCQ